jgi:hypothetical protein
MAIAKAENADRLGDACDSVGILGWPLHPSVAGRS